jgi:hypothetical protein
MLMEMKHWRNPEWRAALNELDIEQRWHLYVVGRRMFR